MAKMWFPSGSSHRAHVGPYILAVGLAMVLALSGCDAIAIGFQGQEPSGTTTVKFKIPSAARALDATARTLPVANEIIYLDANEQTPTLHRQALSGGSNELILPKGSVNVVGFVNNPALARVVDQKSKAISGAIQIIGNLQIVSNGLDSLPISNSAESEIQLGTLTQGANSYSSSINSANLLAAAGYSGNDLSSYSFYDDGFIQTLNPDVDGNGRYDADENRLWQISASREGGIFYRNDFSGATPNVPIPSLIGPLFSIVFWLNRSFPHPEYQTVFLEFPPGNTYVDRTGTEKTGMYANWHGTGEGGGQFNQYYFNYINDEFQTPSTPFAGDYALTISGTTYHFRNLSFPSRTGGNPEGFIFPETRITYDSSGYVQKLFYSWWTVRNGRLERPSETEIRLSAKQYYYYFPRIWVKQPEDFGQLYYRDGVMDLSPYRLKKSELGGVAGAPNALRSVYWDRMGNEWNFSYYYDQDRPAP